MEITYILQLAQLAGYVIIATIFIVMIRADVKVVKVQMLGIEAQLNILNTAFSRLGDVLTQVAVQSNEISNLKKDIDEMRHGRGFVNDITGEYMRTGKVR